MSETCPQCGSLLFEVIEGKTTSAEIKKFVDTSAFYDYVDLHTKPGGPSVAGFYCPRGCSQEEEEFIGDGAIFNVDFEAYEDELRQQTAELKMVCVDIDMEQYKIYVDGYIVPFSKEQVESDGFFSTYMKPGDHRLVVREMEVSKIDRIESNTVYFSVADEETVVVDCIGKGGLPGLSVRRSV